MKNSIFSFSVNNKIFNYMLPHFDMTLVKLACIFTFN